MMEANYTPDGWLGMIVGAKLWIDFRGKHKLVSGLDKLVKELKERGKQARLEQPQQGETVRAEMTSSISQHATRALDVVTKSFSGR